MKITCLGAAGCVTGSCFLMDNGKKYLVDCGLFQGNKSLEEMNRVDWNFNPREISALFLTHAHIDHSGRIPKLVKDGFGECDAAFVFPGEYKSVTINGKPAQAEKVEKEFAGRKTVFCRVS